MPKGDSVKIDTLVNNLKKLTIIYPPNLETRDVFLGLFVTSPGGNNSGQEVNYSGYQRKLVLFGAAVVTGGSAQMQNTNELIFAIVPNNSGSFSYAALFTAVSGGTLLYYTNLGGSFPLTAGVTPTVEIGKLVVYES